LVWSVDSREQRKAHGVMGISNREALRLPKECSRRRDKRFKKHHRSHRNCSEQGSAVIKSLGISSELAGEETLMIVRDLAVATKPYTELVNRDDNFLDQTLVH